MGSGFPRTEKPAEAQKLGSVLVVTQISGEIAAVTGLGEQGQVQSRASVDGAQVWLKDQAAVRERLFVSLREAVAARDVEAVRTLSVTANAIASHPRTGEESAIAAAALGLLTADAQERHEEIMAAERDAERARRAAGVYARSCQPCGALPSDSARNGGPGPGVRSRSCCAQPSRPTVFSAPARGSMWSRGRRAPVSTGCRHSPPTPPSGRGSDVVCPDCSAGPGVLCETPRGYHPSRVARLRRSRCSRPRLLCTTAGEADATGVVLRRVGPDTTPRLLRASGGAPDPVPAGLRAGRMGPRTASDC